MPRAESPDQALDLMLMVDATGSMSDELRYLQSELLNVLTRVRHSHNRRTHGSIDCLQTMSWTLLASGFLVFVVSEIN